MPSRTQLALLAAFAAAAASSPVREALAADDACSGGAGAGCAFHALQHQQRWEVDVAGDTELRAIVPVPARDEPRRSAKEEEKRRLEQPREELAMLTVEEESQRRSNGTCNTWTGGTCLTSGCAASRGATECSTYRCMCQKGFCANSQGACVFDFQEAASQFGFGFAQTMAEIAAKEQQPEQPKAELELAELTAKETQHKSNSTCSSWTGGTCMTSGCAASRGATECSMYRCVCQKGFCANSQGSCVFDLQEAASQFGFGFAQTMAEIAAKEQRPEQPKAELELAELAAEETQSKSNSTCSSWTGGTCMTSGCAASRGATECSMYRCVCQKGFCANSQGTCVFDLQEAASQFGFGFAQTMAEIAAKEQQPEQPKAEIELAELAVEESQRRSNGTCNTWTGGTCLTSGCAASRGATECSTYRCVCQKGFCANSQGACVFDLQEAASQFGFGFAQTMAEIAAKEQRPEQPKAELELAELAAKESQHRSNSTCNTWTGGTCLTSGCAASRGSTECSTYRCMCQKGFCANSQGACVFDFQEAAAQFGFGAPHRALIQTMAKAGVEERYLEGPRAELAKLSAEELHSKLVVRERSAEEEAQNRSNSSCSTWTGGTCVTSGCGASRGATECSMYRCVCRSGFCANSQGVCVFDFQSAASSYGWGAAPAAAPNYFGWGAPAPAPSPWAGAWAAPSGNPSTGGSCMFSSCAASRGPTDCSITTGYQCMCKSNFHAVNGVCVWR